MLRKSCSDLPTVNEEVQSSDEDRYDELKLAAGMSVQKIESMIHVDPLVHLGDVCLVGHGCRATDSIHRRMLLLLAMFEILSIDNDHQEHAGQSLFEFIVRERERAIAYLLR